MKLRFTILFFFVLTAFLSSAEQRCGYRVERVGVPVGMRETAMSYLLVPDSVPAAGSPAVLVLHDHGAHFSIGKEKMVCPMTLPGQDTLTARAVMADAEAWVKRYYDGAFVADSLAKAGYVVLVMDALYWGERAIRQPDWAQGATALREYNHTLRDYQPTFYQQYYVRTTTPWYERILEDDMAGVSYLLSLPYVRADRVACFGFSMGAYRAWQLAAADSRIAVCVAAHWMTTFRHNGGPLPNASAWSMYRPDAYPQRDYPVVAGSIAPRPLLLMYGANDPLFPEEAVLSADSVIRAAYEDVGVGQRYRLESYPVPHRFCAAELHRLLDYLRALWREE